MERMVPSFNGTRGCRPLNFQELPDAIQVNHNQSPASYSYQNVMFNLEKVPEALSFGHDIPQQFHPHLRFLVNGTKDKNLSNSAGKTGNSSQGSLGDLNDLSEDGTEKTEPVWKRMKWTDQMVRILITAVSYAREDASSDGPENEKNHFFAPKGKWRAISNAMVEKGYAVSPQQCEDKINDLNKKYKRLCDILGESISCDVAENPALLKEMNVSEDTKEDVKRILTCRQLFFREMSSYHNGDRKYLPHDETLQQLVQSGLKGKAKKLFEGLSPGMPKRRKRGGDNGVLSSSEIVAPTNKLANVVSVLPQVAIEEQTGLDRGNGCFNVVSVLPQVAIEELTGLNHDNGRANVVSFLPQVAIEEQTGLGRDNGCANIVSVLPQVAVEEQTGLGRDNGRANIVSVLPQVAVEEQTGLGRDNGRANIVSVLPQVAVEEQMGLDRDNGRANVVNVLPHVAVEEQTELDREIISRSLQLEVIKLKLQKQMVELEKQKGDLLKFCQKEDMELHTMRLENKSMMLENKLLAYRIKRRTDRN